MLFVVLLLAACGQGGDDAAPGQDALRKWVGTDVSKLDVQTLDGQKQPFADAVLLEKKPVIFNVWATWCSPCLSEMPTLDALGKTGKYTVIAIATDAEASTVKDFLKKQNWGGGITVWHDPLGAVTRGKLGAVGIPSTYVTDVSLTVKLVAAGERNWAHPKMVEKIEAALGGD
jgi:thiol-disulfide isomerase/thioredoxin